MGRPGLGKRIRASNFSTRSNVQYEQDIIYAARGILNRLGYDIFIATDHKKEVEGKSVYKKSQSAAEGTQCNIEVVRTNSAVIQTTMTTNATKSHYEGQPLLVAFSLLILLYQEKKWMTMTKLERIKGFFQMQRKLARILLLYYVERLGKVE